MVRGDRQLSTVSDIGTEVDERHQANHRSHVATVAVVTRFGLGGLLRRLRRLLVTAVGAGGLSHAAAEPAPGSVGADIPPIGEEWQAVVQKTVVELVDDIDGSEAQETVSFGLDGTAYEIDLTGEHAAALRDSLAPYVGAARKAGAADGSGRRGGQRGSGGGGSASSSDRQRTAQIRAWAREQGMEVNDRGRIPNTVVQAYDAAH